MAPTHTSLTPTAKTNPAFALGAFVVGAVVLAFFAILLLAGSNLFNHKERVIMYFVGSVQGLQIGAPIKLKGVVLGEITDIQINFKNNDKSITTPQTIITAVTAELIMKRINRRSADAKGEFFNEAIQNGLRAQLNFQSFLTGLLYIELDFYPKTPVVLYRLQNTERELPTIATEFEEIFKIVQELDVKGLVKNLDHLTAQATVIIDSGAIEKTLADFSGAAIAVKSTAEQTRVLISQLDSTRQAADNLLQQFNSRTPQLATSLNNSLINLQQSLLSINQAAQAVDNNFAADAPLIYQLNTTLDDMSRAAQAVRSLSETLEQQPEALVRGKFTVPQK